MWTKQQDDNPETAFIVEAGLNKLEGYRDRADLAPAYVLAMSMHVSSHSDTTPADAMITVINPAMKLEWFRKHQPENVESAKQLFLREVSYITRAFYSCTEIFTLLAAALSSG